MNRLGGRTLPLFAIAPTLARSATATQAQVLKDGVKGFVYMQVWFLSLLRVSTTV